MRFGEGRRQTDRIACILLGWTLLIPSLLGVYCCPMPVPTRAKEPLLEMLPFEERIRRRAYELYVQRGNQSGSELDDWLQSEEEMLQAQEQVIDEAKARRRG